MDEPNTTYLPETDAEERLLARIATEEASRIALFRELANTWREETSHFSLEKQKVRHPAYQQIIGMGQPAIPLILRELRERPNFWFHALSTISGQNPAEGAKSVDAAIQAWLAWGREREYID